MPTAKLETCRSTTIRPSVVVIGAGIGGLTSAIRLAIAGYQVCLLERHSHVGGKIRTSMSEAGPIDAGPTVLTMRHIFDELFRLADSQLDDHVALIRQDILARHFWPNNQFLDLHAHLDGSARAIRDFSGKASEREFRSYCKRCHELFWNFNRSMMRTAEPRLLMITRQMLARPRLIRHVSPFSTLADMLRRQFSDPRLAQLFGRYSTYVGGSPYRSPAVLALIWQAEASGVWVIKGGMHKLATALAELATAHGVDIRLNTHVDRIGRDHGWVNAVHLSNGNTITADAVIYNGDPRALAMGSLGSDCLDAAPQTLTSDRSFSARVYSFAARVTGPDLAHHNVFFDADPVSEFNDLHANRIPRNPTIYLCAEDRGQGHPPPETERFEIITNAPIWQHPEPEEDLQKWHQSIFQKLRAFKLEFDPPPDLQALTTPEEFHRLFPESQGALYGQSPHGFLASFRRPTARTPVPGLYLAGGGTHPGAGLPMAALSGMHAAETIKKDLILT